MSQDKYMHDPVKPVVKTGLRNASIEELMEELSKRLAKIEIADIKFRMNQQIEHEAEISSLSKNKIKRELARIWLKTA